MTKLSKTRLKQLFDDVSKLPKSKFTTLIDSLWRDLPLIDKDPTGFQTRSTSQLSFSNGTRTFSISPVGTSFVYYRDGLPYSFSEAQSVVISNVTGVHFIYFDTTNTLVASTTPWGFDANLVMVAYVYWYAPGQIGLIGEERHGMSMDWATHKYLHDTFGTRYETGLTGTFNNSGTFEITAGEIHDEDINHHIALQTAARIFYRDASGAWKFETGSTFFKTVAGVLQYDNAGVLTNVSTAKYVAYFIFATNDYDYPVFSLMGQAEESTLANAEMNLTPEALSYGTLPQVEFKLLYRVILQRNGTSVSVSTITDYRADQELGRNGLTPTDHALLTNLNSTNYYHLTIAEYTDLITRVHNALTIAVETQPFLQIDENQQITMTLEVECRGNLRSVS